MFFLITWKEFVKRKLIDKAEIIKGDDINASLNEMKTFNAQKRLTTTDYRAYNLSSMFEDQSLTIVEKFNEE